MYDQSQWPGTVNLDPNPRQCPVAKISPPKEAGEILASRATNIPNKRGERFGKSMSLKQVHTFQEGVEIKETTGVVFLVLKNGT